MPPSLDYTLENRPAAQYLWNSLPAELRDFESLAIFKRGFGDLLYFIS